MLSLEDAIYKVKQAVDRYERASFNANVEPNSWDRRPLVEKVEAAETAVDEAIARLVDVAKAEEAEATRDAYIEAARSAIFTQAKARRVKFSEIGNKSDTPTV
jgi:hypothetical protein